MDIDSWRGISLAQYAEMFRANDIDMELLGRLTKTISGTSAWCRSSITKNCWKRLRSLPVPFLLPQPALSEPKAQDSAERRKVTVMFSDLVGSTALFARLGLQELIDLAKEIRVARRRGEDEGLSQDEIAFYDALAESESAVELMGNDSLKLIAHKLLARGGLWSM